jgi:hypothetical protein
MIKLFSLKQQQQKQNAEGNKQDSGTNKVTSAQIRLQKGLVID